MLPIERKVVDITQQVMPDVGGPIVVILSALAQGVAVDERIGNAVTWTSIQGKISLRLGTSGINQCRLMVVLDKMPDQAVILGANVLDDIAIPMISPLNLNNNRRFRVLWSRNVSWSASGPSAIRQVSFFKRLRLTTRYTGPNFNVNTITAGSLFFLIFSPQATGDAPVVHFHIRQRFIG